MICVSYGWILGCHGNIEPAKGIERISFPRLRSVIVVTSNEAGTCRTNVAGGIVPRSCDYVIVSRDCG